MKNMTEDQRATTIANIFDNLDGAYRLLRHLGVISNVPVDYKAYKNQGGILKQLRRDLLQILFPAPELPSGYELISFVEADDHTKTLDETISGDTYRQTWAEFKLYELTNPNNCIPFDVLVTCNTTVISGTTAETIEPSEEPATKTKVRITAEIEATITQADVDAQANHFIEHLVGCAAIGYVDYSNVEDIKLVDKKYTKVIT